MVRLCLVVSQWSVLSRMATERHYNLTFQCNMPTIEKLLCFYTVYWSLRDNFFRPIGQSMTIAVWAVNGSNLIL